MKKSLLLIFLLTFILLTSLPAVSLMQVKAQAGSVYDLIAAVNALRSAQGLTTLEIDGSLMSIAQTHSDYMASVGYWTHEGADGSTPKERASAAGFGSGGTIYVSENVAVLNTSATFDTLIYSIWSDSLHWNTMTNANYTHAGAGITVSGDEVYYTLDVAYVAGTTGSYVSSSDGTSSSTTNDSSTQATSVAANVVSPVITSTPHEDGSVYHVVEPGQALWSIAIAYNTTIQNIIDLNGLPTENPSIWQGDELLIQSSLVPSSTVPVTATVPPPTSTPRPTYTIRPTVPTSTATVTPTATPEPLISMPSIRSMDRRTLGITIIAICAVGLLVVIITGFRPSK